MINSLQSLRFIFAIMIFIHHYTINGQGLFPIGGACGVSFFIILSGFVMAAGYSVKIEEPTFNYKSFILKRLIRLYPLHILCLLSFICIHISHLNMMEYIKLIPNVLLLQSWIPIKHIYFSGNAVSWCLSDMIFFYTIFPFLWKKLKTQHNCVFLFVILMLYLCIMTLLPKAYGHALLYISPIFRLQDFIIGMLTYKFYAKLKESQAGRIILGLSFFKKSVVELSSITLLIFAIILAPHIEERYYFAFLWWFIMPVLILIFALFNKTGGAFSRILNTKILTSVGNFSFSFYMIHQLAIGVLNRIAHKLNIDLLWSIQMAIIFSVILIISYIVYHHFEIPISNYLKRKLI